VELAPKICLNILKLCKAMYFLNALLFDVQKDYAAKVGHLNRDSSVFR
jgi:cyclophilin family peptidyl-prolyl cis-trans isomerase